MHLRTKRVATALHNNLSAVLFKQPGLQFVSVVHVDLSDNLQRAKVHLSSLSAEHTEESIMASVMASKGRIMKELAALMSLKRMPQIKFFCV